MRILYINAIEQNANWGAEWFMNKAFRALSHDTYCIDYRENRQRLYQEFHKAPTSDVFFLQRGDDFPISLIKPVQTPRLFWASELVSRNRDQDQLLKSNLFDHIFFRTDDCIEAAASHGWVNRANCSVLLSSFDKTLHRLIPDIPRDIDVLFVGSLTERRRRILAQVQPYFDLVATSAYGEDLVRLFNRAKIVLNIHADDYLDTETRVFEALGCGAFLLTERLSPENPFSQRELVEFENVEDLCNKVQQFLVHDAKRKRIAESGHRTALRNHTYAHRAQEIIEVMSNYVSVDGEKPKETLRRNWQLHAYGVSEWFQRQKYGLAKKAKGSLSRMNRFVRNLQRT